jgi:hypothetical protein
VPVTTRSEAAIAAITSQLTRSNDPASVLFDIVSNATACLGLIGAAVVAKSVDEDVHVLCATPVEHATGVWADLYVSAPVVEAVRQGTVVVVDDVSEGGHRWVAVRELLGSVGVRGVRVFPVRIHGTTFGALVTLTANPWGQRASATGQTLADLAALVLSQGSAVERQQLALAQIVELLESQVSTNQAYGMLAEAGGLTIDEAAAVLAGYAQFYRVTQAEVADWLVADASRIPTVLGGPGDRGPAGTPDPASGEPTG